MSDIQSLLHNALLEYDKADKEVERLLDIIDQATIDLEKARQSKRTAKIQLDEAISSASGVPLVSSVAVEEAKDSSYSEYYSSEEEESSQSCSSSSSSGSDDDEVEESNELDESSAASAEEDDQFDIADEALEQIRYRLKVAKIDPSTPQGASLLDELLIRLKRNDDTISDDLIDEIMDDLINDNEGSYDEEESHYDLFVINGEGSYDGVESHTEDDESCEEEDNYDEAAKQSTRIKISRGGKVLGWYEGGLDDRGYAREGEGTMYYNAGHECSGCWKDDEMVGRGVYKWADGHVYDGEWLKGKRHGLGRFIRPDGVVLFGRYEEGHHVGQGIRFSADKKDAQIVEDGVPKGKIDMSDAFKMKKDLGFDEDLLP